VETEFLGFTCSQERILFDQFFGLAVACTLLDHGSISADFCYLLCFLHNVEAILSLRNDLNYNFS